MEPSGTNQAAALQTEDKAGARAADGVFTLRLWEWRDSVLERCSISIISFVLRRLRAPPTPEKLSIGNFASFVKFFLHHLEVLESLQKRRVSINAELGKC